MVSPVRTYRNGVHATLFAVLPFLLLSCSGSGALVSGRDAAVLPRNEEVRNGIFLAAIGDIMTHTSMHAAARRSKDGYDPLFDRVRQDLEAADITIANLETPVDDHSPASGYPRFNAGPRLLGAIKRAGIDVISIANNHIMDRGTRGLERTISNIEKAGLVFIGAGRTKQEAVSVRRLTVGGIRTAFLAYTYSTNERAPGARAEQPGVNVLRTGDAQGLARVVEQVRAADAAADITVVSLHWGGEYRTEPSSWQRHAAAALVDAGADVVLGHHPHVLQPIETLTAADGRMGIVAYSLGNFMSGQYGGFPSSDTRKERALRGDGMILLIRVSRQQEKGALKLRAEYIPLCTLRERVGPVSVARPVNIRREQALLKGKQERTGIEDRLGRFMAERERLIAEQVAP